MNEASGVYEFVRIGEMAETTTQLLALNLQSTASLGSRQRSQRNRDLEQVEMLILQQARDYLSAAKEGFTLSVRTSQASSAAEIRFLVDRVLLDWDQLSAELGLDELFGDDSEQSADTSPEPIQLEKLQHQLLAYGMATTALGYLPRLPTAQVTFPYSHGELPTYADIPTPSSAGELLWRIEEMEKTLWQLMANDLQELVNHCYGPLRRTYGFFETSAHLTQHESRRFGVKKPKPKLSFL